MRENMLYNPSIYQLRELQLTRMLEIIKGNRGSKENGVVFVGDSITEFMDVKKYFPFINNFNNCGVAGITSKALLWFLDEGVIKYKPNHVVLMVGTNDFGNTLMSSPRDVALNIKEFVDIVSRNLEDVKFTIVSPLPCDEKLHGDRFGGGCRNNFSLSLVYTELASIFINNEGVEVLNIFPYLLNSECTNIKEEFTSDGLHLTPEGYEVYTGALISKSKFLKKC